MEPLNLLPSFGGFLWTLGAFVVAISIIVAVHEYGHYIVGRWTGIKAEVFSLGMGPVMWSRMDRHGTRWQVAALPVGGYVKFLGDANAASVGHVEVEEDRKRMTMLGAPLWARAATVAAGPVFNFIFSILLFMAIFLGQGRPVDPLTVAGIVELPPTYESGLQPGDEILEIGGQGMETGLPTDLPLTATHDYVVRRDGVEMTVSGPHPLPSRIGTVTPRSAAMDAGLKSGDTVTAIGGETVVAFEQLFDAVGASDGQPMDLTIWREGETLEFTVTPRMSDLPSSEGGFETRWLLGASADLSLVLETERLGPWESFTGGMRQTWFIVTSSLSGLWHMITGAISTCNLSSPVGIAETSGAMASEGGTSFLWFVAVISTAVGLLNLFPIPVLDGGHLVFHAFEAVTGRPPSDRALRWLMAAGLSAVLTLMLFALANDLFLCP